LPAFLLLPQVLVPVSAAALVPEMQTNPPAETRFPMHCPALPAPAPPERVAAPCAAAGSMPRAHDQSAAVAPPPNEAPPSAPQCSSARNVSIGTGSPSTCFSAPP